MPDKQVKPFSPMAAMTQTEVAEEMTRRGDPMTRTRVQQIETRALQKLRNCPEIEALFKRVLEGTI